MKKLAPLLTGLLLATTTQAATETAREKYNERGPSVNKLNFVATLSGGMVLADPGAEDFHYVPTSGGPIQQYTPNEGSSSDFLFGGFLGLEIPIFNAAAAIQIGVGYYYLGSFDVDGTLDQFINTTPHGKYDYSYQINSSQLLLESKISMVFAQRFRPYIALGIGAAFNSAKDFDTTTIAENFAPFVTFPDGSNTALSYMAGIGIDVDIVRWLRLGIGYRYSSLGSINLGDAQTTPSYSFTASPGNLKNDLTAHQFLGQISFVF